MLLFKASGFLHNYWNSPCEKARSHYGTTMEAIEQPCTSKEQYSLAANYQSLDFNGLFMKVGSKINQNCCPKMVLFEGPNLFTGLHQYQSKCKVNGKQSEVREDGPGKLALVSAVVFSIRRGGWGIGLEHPLSTEQQLAVVKQHIELSLHSHHHHSHSSLAAPSRLSVWALFQDSDASRKSCMRPQQRNPCVGFSVRV